MALIGGRKSFLQTSPGPCIICGAPDQTCMGETPTHYKPPETIYLAAEFNWPWRSKERVWWRNPATGQEELRYGEGWPIPLLEALRQGIVKVSELNDEQKEKIRAHAKTNPDEVKAVLRALKRPPLNRALSGAETVQKETR